MGLPLGDIKDVFTAGNDAVKKRKEPVRIALFIEQGASEHMVEVVRNCLRPELATGMIHVEKFVKAHEPQLNSLSDCILIVAASNSEESALLHHRVASHDLRGAVLCAHPDEFAQACGRANIIVPHSDVLSGADEHALIAVLASWILENNKHKSLAFAANFPFVRSELAHSIVLETAKQNAIVGGVVIIPGADMPVMTANQAKMILQIAAAYGQELGPERIKELVFAVGSGFAMRTAARQVLSVIPALGWAVKAGIGYTGTLAMGKAVISYFEQGASVAGLAQQVYELSADFAAKVSQGAQDQAGTGGNVQHKLEAARESVLRQARGVAGRVKEKAQAVKSGVEQRVSHNSSGSAERQHTTGAVRAEDVVIRDVHTGDPTHAACATESSSVGSGVGDRHEASDGSTGTSHVVIEPLIVDPQK